MNEPTSEQPAKPRYTLAELLAQCDPEDWLTETEEDRLWLDAKPVGRELL